MGPPAPPPPPLTVLYFLSGPVLCFILSSPVAECVSDVVPELPELPGPIQSSTYMTVLDGLSRGTPTPAR
jgi:hypothetical protein